MDENAQRGSALASTSSGKNSTTASTKKQTALSRIGKQLSIRSGRPKDKEVEHIVVYLPAPFPSCPPGLEKLINTNHLFVRQGMRQQDPPFALISKTKFEVLNGEGERIFLAKESMDNILKLCCRGGCGQPFEMSIKDKNSGYEILAVNGNPDCYGAMTAVVSQNGMSIGFINEELRCCSSNYSLIDAQGKEIFKIYDVGNFIKWNRENAAKARRANPSDYQSLTTPPSASTPTNPMSPTTTATSISSTITLTPMAPQAGCMKQVKLPSSISFQEPFPDRIRSTTSSTLGEQSPTVIYPHSSREASTTPTQMTVSFNTAVVGVKVKAPLALRPYCCCCSGSSSNLGIGGCLDRCVDVISGGLLFHLWSCEMGAVVGEMSKQFEQLYDQYFNLVDCFGVNFPRETSVRHKALLLGALFLLDFNHFQL